MKRISLIILLLSAFILLPLGVYAVNPDDYIDSDWLPLDSSLSHGASSALKTWTEPVTGIEFVWIPGGSYMMGSKEGNPDEKQVVSPA